MKKMCSFVLCFILLSSIMSNFFVSGASVTDTFTHWTLANGDKKAVGLPPVYEAKDVVNTRSLGIKEDLGIVSDIDTDKSGNTYVLTDSSNVYSFDKDLKLNKVYSITDLSGNAVDYSGAKGIYVKDVDKFYIADTKNSRVLYVESDTVHKQFGLPESSLIPSDFEFQPYKIITDSKNYMYVISNGSYYGALLYAPNGEFVGFYGANSVEGNVLTTLSYLWDKLTMNDEKRAKVKKTLPYQFADICIDQHDFIYTCTAMTGASDTNQIKMLSPGGTNILANSSNLNFGENDLVKRFDTKIRQNFNGIEADGNGFIYALDATYGLIYIYDTDCNMIAAFGGGRGLGNKKGVFAAANSIALEDSRIMIADTLRNSVTVYNRTDFGSVYLKAQQLTLKADYKSSKPLWESVLDFDSTNRLALCGLAKASYSEGNYKEAQMYAKQGNDATTYSLALKKVQNSYIAHNFIWIFALVIFLIVGTTWLLIITRKKQIIFIKNEKLRIMFASAYHPFQNFNSIKYKKMGSLKIAISLTALYFLTSAMAVLWSDFRYTTFDTATYNSVMQMVKTSGLIVLWSLANWAFSTLKEGKGRLKEVYIVSSYSIYPLIINNIISTVLTHFISSQNSAFISGLKIFAMIFTGIMLTIGLMIIHDFTFTKFLETAFVTVIFMILIVFVLFMIGMLLSQFTSFIGNIFFEAVRWKQ